MNPSIFPLQTSTSFIPMLILSPDSLPTRSPQPPVSNSVSPTEGTRRAQSSQDQTPEAKNNNLEQAGCLIHSDGHWRYPDSCLVLQLWRSTASIKLQIEKKHSKCLLSIRGCVSYCSGNLNLLHQRETQS